MAPQDPSQTQEFLGNVGMAPLDPPQTGSSLGMWEWPLWEQTLLKLRNSLGMTPRIFPKSGNSLGMAPLGMQEWLPWILPKFRSTLGMQAQPPWGLGGFKWGFGDCPPQNPKPC